MKKIIILSLALFFCYSCKESINPCEEVVCKNGGACDNEGNCNCPPEFKGANCELLANPKEIKISKIIVTEFFPTNGAMEWDTSDGPDLYITMSKGTITGGTILEKTNTIENCVHGNEYEFIVDWSIEGNELAYNFDLRDDDDSNLSGFPYNRMGENFIYPMDYRADKPTLIDLPADQYFGIRLEVEWIFE